MSYDVTVRALPSKPALVIRGSMRQDELPAFFASAYGELYAYAARHGVMPDGPPFARYPNISNASAGAPITVEAGVTLPRAVDGDGRVEMSELPGGECAVTEHIGPYDAMEPAYQALEAWMRANRRAPAGGPWEVYHSDPAQEPDPQKWRTEIFWPLA
jgi:effector-binding domain-containing protein